MLARLIADGRLAPLTIDPAVLRKLPKEPQDSVNVAELLAADRDEERW